MNPILKLRETIGRLTRERPGLLVAAVAVLTAGVISVTLLVAGGDGGAGSTPALEPRQFTISPSGDEVDRLAPVRVTFERPPAQRDGAAILRLEPAVEGEYLWQSERTVIFQPAYPGLLRGFQYTVHVAAQPEAGLDRDRSQSFKTAGALSVESVIPAPDDVEVPQGVQVLVQFNRAVAPLTLLASTPDAPVVVFEPPLAGRGEWLNTSLYRFVPDDGALAPNTRYEARIPADLSDGPDGDLSADYTWRFTSFGPAIDAVTPAASTQYVGPAQDVTVRFNQSMDLASVEAGFSLLRDGAHVPGAFRWSEGDRVVTYAPDGGLDLQTSYQVVVAAGLKGASGGSTPVEWRSSFSTVGLPAVASTRPENGSTAADRYGVSIRFTNPMDEESLEGKISISGIDAEDVRQYLTPDELMLSINASFEPSTYYEVSLAAGAMDRYGQALPPFSFSFTTGQRPSSISLAIPAEIATYSASVEPILYFHATNSREATFTLYPLTDAETAHLQEQNYIDRGNPLEPKGFVPSSPPLRSWSVDVSGDLDQVVLKSTSLSQDGRPLPRGNYYVETNGQYRSAMAFSVVDTALITKISHDELLVWAVDLDSGRPLPGLSLTADGGPLAGSDTLQTDSDGLASFALPSLIGEPQVYNRRSYVVRLASDGRFGVASTDWRGPNTYDLGIPTEYYPKTYVGHVYTDRPIYRPGEEVLYKGIIRLDDDADYSIPDSLDSVFLTINDPTGKELKRQPVSLNDFGSFADALVLADDAATGDYYLNILWQPSQQITMPIAGWTFLVAEFRTPEFEVSVRPERDSYVQGETIDAVVDASFFFGGALEGAKVEWSAVGGPAAPRFAGYERYSFVNSDDARTQVSREPVRSTGEAVTDARGEARIQVPAVINGDEGPQQYQIAAAVTDQNAQQVAASANVMVHRAAVYAGIRSTQYVVTTGNQAEAQLVAVDLDGNALPGREISVDVYDRTWVTTKEQTPDGARRYRSEPRDTLLATLPATTDAEGLASVSYTPSKAGTLRFVARIRDDQGRQNNAAAQTWVTGGGRASWRVTNDDALQLIADGEEYRVGDVARVLVPAPFEGATGLVTIERGRVQQTEVRTFATNSEVIEVPITDAGVPNVYVGVVLYRPPTGEDPVSRYKVGYVQLKVSTDVRLLNVSITPDREQAQPGDTVHYDIEVTDHAGKGVRSELSVSVVDKAVLSLAAERGPDGLQAFWFERGLGVRTTSSLGVSVDRLNDVISEAAAGGKGGGGFDDENLRQDFRTSAYWQAQLVTDDNGRVGVDVKMPDNLTTWRLQARAISGDILVGEATSELLSTQPLLLRPALPRFLRVGDQPAVRLLVRNATKEATTATVSIEAEGIEVDAAQRSVQVGAGESALMEWPATATAEGTARIAFRATTESGLSDAIEQRIPVYLDITPETTATGGVVKDGPLSEAVYLPPFAIIDKGSLKLSLQASLTQSFADKLDEYRPTVWESSERKASRIITTLAVLRADPEAARSVPYSDSQLASDVAALIAGQRGDGGWAWCSMCQSNPQITAWVLIALGQWRQDGHPIDDTVLDRAIFYVRDYVNRITDVARPADANEKAHLLYALSVAGRPDAGLPIMRSVLEQSRARLTNWGRAYLLLGFSEAGLTRKDTDVSTLLNDLAQDVIPNANGNHWEDEHIDGSTQTNPRTTALVLRALVATNPQHALIEETVRWLAVALGTEVCRTPIERAEAILALSDYAAETGELGASYDYKVALNDQEVLDGRLESGEAEPVQQSFDLATLGKGTSVIELARDFGKRGRMYYTLALRYVTPARDIEALNRGFAVTHEYSLLADAATPVTDARLGDTVRVKVTVVAPADRKYVVVEDALPAGLEAINPRLRTTDPLLVATLNEERRQASAGSKPAYVAPWFRWYYNPWQQIDVRDDRVVLQAEDLPKGVYEYIYYARATTPGEFFVAPPHAEESYFPEVFGRGDSGRFTVAP